MLRWWERWLNGVENGVDREPPIAIYVQGANTWRYEDELAAAGPCVRPLVPRRQTSTLIAERPAADVLETAPCRCQCRHVLHALGPVDPAHPLSRPTTARTTPSASALPRALSRKISRFAASPWPRSGSPRAPPSFLTARLCAVAPNGLSTLICRGWEPFRPPPAEPLDLAAPAIHEQTIVLDATSFVVPSGCRLRLTIGAAISPCSGRFRIPSRSFCVLRRTSPRR